MRSDAGDRIFYIRYPFFGHSILPGIEHGHDLLLNNIIDHLGIQFILELLVSIGPRFLQSPSGFGLVSFGPPAVQDAEVQHSVHQGFFTTCAGCFERPCRGVQPYIHTLDQFTGHFYIVVFNEEYLADHFLAFAQLDDALDQVLAGMVGRMGLACKDDLQGAFLIIQE